VRQIYAGQGFMSKKTKQNQSEIQHPADAPDTYEALEQAAARRGLFGRVNQRLNEAIDQNRSGNGPVNARAEGRDNPGITADDLALRRAKGTNLKRMVIPDGVIIDGSFTSGSETEIEGRVDGDVTVEGNVSLGATALVSGNVRATNSVVQGLVEGKMECTGDLLLGESGRLNADSLAGQQMIVQGQIFGNVACRGTLRLTATAKVTGNIRARTLIIEDGAVFNGHCAMRAPSQRSEK